LTDVENSTEINEEGIIGRQLPNGSWPHCLAALGAGNRRETQR
jgi:hypothetical protein